ncbi:peptidoglycan DD-metalloendopeptidase family protein [Paenibacillus sp. PsM32]|uniref:peptidoglycan DD-metalloendopeptidase family protein n=1 Tax=Paenibacillus sp. PsM32 TaxID=3030536 RepID=UPI00263A45FE|nr:peptidoglycan DD-metalloendopeptidase family protein [Paenibacillus sp. PsM32]MDN4619399.1 peptidoglycan DD-metalloendopeptidase family protein [Paenibacillus sp. PsM32]
MKKNNNITWIHYSKWALALGALTVAITACSGTNTAQPATTVDTTTPTTATEQPTTPTAKLTAEEVPTALLEGQYKEVYAQFSDNFKKQISEKDFVSSAEASLQSVKAFNKAADMEINDADVRSWVSDSGNIGLNLTIDQQGTILGLQAKALTPTPATDKVTTENEYAFPFKGDWFVFWGGNNALINYHYEYESQRYAYDFIQRKDGFSYKGDPLKNESYYAFGQPLYAPADGKVVSVLSNIPDNEPVGKMNPKVPAGNEIVIAHSNGEYSVIGHMKKGSALVKVGDRVKTGDKLGLVGNSGNSSEAHLHYQVSDGADLFKSKAIQIKWQDGSKPVQGETIIAK